MDWTSLIKQRDELIERIKDTQDRKKHGVIARSSNMLAITDMCAQIPLSLINLKEPVGENEYLMSMPENAHQADMDLLKDIQRFINDIPVVEVRAIFAHQFDMACIYR